jgi:hypothetical protein
MKILQVTEEELSVLEKGLGLWESQPSMDGLLGSMFGCMLGVSGATKKERMADTQKAMDRASVECQKRKLQAARLRVKFLEVQERPSEFEAQSSPTLPAPQQ